MGVFVFIGDSTVRYFFLTLILVLRGSKIDWIGCKLECPWNERTYRDWGHFYNSTSSGSLEIHCDCFRNGTRLEEITENRYTTIGNDSFVYLQMFGHNIGGVWRRGFDDTLRLPREEYHHNNWTELLV